ncbi:ribosome biogenesis GTPase [Geomicrobium halophilum]|uniref:Small ribosomal subunit biogenesis GTPase RsgA n=1 Tax=Geomicrobium halophilum TaxID=549000 RepID=A0A841PNJ7_9BACL|nr:ribosome small subunit-dependent GTPase A [Geomicrobium halophilum]MBB6449344.1 ribosome biogenesis GTPase [Geomicrobium halophilum]
MQEGQIVKAVGGFYEVKNEEGVFRCRARGLFRKQKIKPLVGDFVQFEHHYIQAVLKRDSELHRPPVANIDQAFLVFSMTKPAFSPYLLDRMLVHVEAIEADAVIVVTKKDIATEEELAAFREYQDIYQGLGYPLIFVSGQKGENSEALLPYLKGRLTVLAGQSGVGKSTLLNHLDPNLSLETGEISEGLARGKHTTRQVELLNIAGGSVADTPGFSSLDFTGIEPELVQDCFREIREVRAACKYRGCTHRKEDGCAVKEATASGEIASTRHEHYMQFYDEIEKNRRY